MKQSIKGGLEYCSNGPMGVRSPMYKNRSKKGSENKWWDFSYVSKTIEKQGIEGGLGYCANGPMGVISPMSKTRLKQDIEVKWGDCSNAFETIEKQDNEIILGHCDNGPMTIGKSNFERGMTTYVHKNGKDLKYTSASQQRGCKQKRKNMIWAPHHPKANVGVVLIHQYYQQIIR